MKSLRFVLSVVLMSLATVAFAQSDAHKMAEPCCSCAEVGGADFLRHHENPSQGIGKAPCADRHARRSESGH